MIESPACHSDDLAVAKLVGCRRRLLHLEIFFNSEVCLFARNRRFHFIHHTSMICDSRYQDCACADAGSEQLATARFFGVTTIMVED